MAVPVRGHVSLLCVLHLRNRTVYLYFMDSRMVVGSINCKFVVTICTFTPNLASKINVTVLGAKKLRGSVVHSRGRSGLKAELNAFVHRCSRLLTVSYFLLTLPPQPFFFFLISSLSWGLLSRRYTIINRCGACLELEAKSCSRRPLIHYLQASL